MRKWVGVLIVAGWFAGVPARAAIVLNFDDLPGATNTANGAKIPNASGLWFDHFQASYGLLITSWTNSLAPNVGVGVAQFGSATNSPPNAIVPSDTLGQFKYSEFLAFTFVSPSNYSQPATTDFFSLQDPINSGKSITMYAFDANDQLLASVTHVANGTVTWSLSTPGIHLVRFGDPTSNPIFAADNVTFNPITAPEVATMALVLPTAVALLVRRRRSCDWARARIGGAWDVAR